MILGHVISIKKVGFNWIATCSDCELTSVGPNKVAVNSDIHWMHQMVATQKDVDYWRTASLEVIAKLSAISKLVDAALASEKPAMSVYAVRRILEG